MWIKQRIVLVAVAVLQCVCLCFMLLGITGGFDTTLSTQDSDEFHVEEKEKEKNGTGTGADTGAQVPEKVVLVVIDALRLDFMSKENFPFLMGSLRQYQSTTFLKFDVKVDSPTVTLPRVKVRFHLISSSGIGFALSMSEIIVIFGFTDSSHWKITGLYGRVEELSDLPYIERNQPTKSHKEFKKRAAEFEDLLFRR